MSQNLPDFINTGNMPRPQNRPHSDSPGRYDLVFRRPRTEVTPGEEAEVEIYITGYREISNAKLYFVPPSNFVEPADSRVEFDLGPKEKGGPARYGVTSMPMGDMGMTIDLSSGGFKPPHWPGPSLFFDTGISIATKKGTPEPPIRVILKAKKKIASGDRNFSFALTYFNGREWSISYRTASLHVPTLYERYEGKAWTLGTIIAVIVTVASVIAAVASVAGGSPSPGPISTPSQHVTTIPASQHTKRLQV